MCVCVRMCVCGAEVQWRPVPRSPGGQHTLNLAPSHPSFIQGNTRLHAHHTTLPPHHPDAPPEDHVFSSAFKFLKGRKRGGYGRTGGKENILALIHFNSVKDQVLSILKDRGIKLRKAVTGGVLENMVGCPSVYIHSTEPTNL